MFPHRFFPSKYFAPRYWPKVGVTPPGIIRILLNGLDVTDRIWYGSNTSWNGIRGTRGTCVIPFIVEPGETFTAEVGERIRIYDPRTERVWSGHVDRTSVRWLGDDGWHVVFVTGISLEALFDTIDLDKVKYSGVTCGAAVADLLDLSGVTMVGEGTIDAGPLVESLEVGNIARGFAELALLAGFIWYVDPLDECLYFHHPAARDADWTVGSTDIQWDSIDWQQDRADYRTAQVVQLQGVSMQPIQAVFAGDDATTSFTLPSIPEYIISIVISIGSSGRSISWAPGTAQVVVTPALPAGASLTVRYSDEGLVAETTPSTAIGAKTATYTKTRTFTPEGGLQEAQALLARYSMLPSELMFATFRPGIRVGRKLAIDVDFPENASSRLNGNWMVKEVDAVIVPGIDQREDPVSSLAPDLLGGHFRYTVRLVNTAATAVFQGDGETTDFELPVVPESIQNTRISVPDRVATWTPATTSMSIVPALPRGASAAVDYVDPVNSPDTPSFLNTWEDMASSQTAPPVVLSSEPPGQVEGEAAAEERFLRTLTLYDTTVRDDAAPHTLVYADGMSFRLLGVLRQEIASDLTIRINKGPQFALEELITVTIPSTALINEVFEWAITEGSPPLQIPFFDKEILTADILASDGSTEADGVAQFTVEWTGPLYTVPVPEE
jgi:hypothetical protein